MDHCPSPIWAESFVSGFSYFLASCLTFLDSLALAIGACAARSALASVLIALKAARTTIESVSLMRLRLVPQSSHNVSKTKNYSPINFQSTSFEQLL